MTESWKTLMNQLKLTAASDTVNHSFLLDLKTNIKRWLLSYLQGRFRYFECWDAKSGMRKVNKVYHKLVFSRPISSTYKWAPGLSHEKLLS